MNDQSITILIDSLGINTPQILELLDGVFIRQLRNIWGCTGVAEYIPQTMAIRVSISAPELLIYGIERKLNEIIRNPEDESLYVIDPYPQETRPRTHVTLEINAIQFDSMYSDPAAGAAPIIDMGGITSGSLRTAIMVGGQNT